MCFTIKRPGNLYQKIKLASPTRLFTMEKQSWLSDFQSQNDDVPPELAAFISETFKKNPLKIQTAGKQESNSANAN